MIPRDEYLLNPQPQDDDLSALLAEYTAQPEPDAPDLDQLAEYDRFASQRKPDPTGPGQHELDYLAANPEQPGWQRALGAVGAALRASAGDNSAISEFHTNQALRGRGLETARAADRKSPYLDRGAAELLMLAGMSPEAAANAREDSLSVKLAPTLGQLKTRQTYQQLQADLRQRQLEATQAQREQQNQYTEHRLGNEDKRLELAAKKKGGGGLGAPMTPEAKAQREKDIANVIAQMANTTPDKVLAIQAGNVDGVEPDEAGRIQAAMSSFALMSAKDKSSLIKQRAAGEATDLDRPGVAGKTKAAQGENDKKERLKLKTEFGDVRADVSRALNAWNNMSPPARKAFTQLAGGGDLAQALKSMRLSPQEQAYAGDIQALANTLIKARSGSAVTGTEWNRVAQEIGLPTGDFSIFNSTAGVTSWLNKAREGIKRRAAAIESEYEGLLKGGE